MSTPVFCCGAECGIVAVGAAGGTLHWGAVSGVVTADTTTFRSPGLRAYKFAAAGVSNYLARNFIAGQNIGVIRVAVRFATLPAANCSILAFTTASSFCFLGFITATSKLCVSASGNLASRQESANAIVAGQWYIIDLKFNISANPWLIDWKIDAVGQTQFSSALAASTFVQLRVGGIVDTTAGTPTYNLFVDDIIYGHTAADFPFGDGHCVGLSPNADGTHVFNLAGDFKYTNTVNVAVGATDTWSRVNSVPLTQITNFMAVVTASITEYLEWQFSDTPAGVTTINGLEVVSRHHSATATANKQTLRINDGGTLSDVATDQSHANTTGSYNSKHYATAPTGGAWTKTKVDALRARWNSSYGTVDESPVPFIDGVMFEVDYVATGGTAYTLDAAPGAYGLTGVATGFLSTYVMNAVPGSYALTGQAASVLAARLLNASPGAYVLNGFDVALIPPAIGYTLSADAGSYGVSGAPASTLAARLLNAAPGSFGVAGQVDAQLVGHVLISLEGDYVVSGKPVALLIGSVLFATPGVYSVTGYDAQLIKSSIIASAMSANPGAYGVTGYPVSFERSILSLEHCGIATLYTYEDPVADIFTLELPNDKSYSSEETTHIAFFDDCGNQMDLITFDTEEVSWDSETATFDNDKVDF
jgi:hypothetical protein